MAEGSDNTILLCRQPKDRQRADGRQPKALGDCGAVALVDQDGIRVTRLREGYRCRLALTRAFRFSRSLACARISNHDGGFLAQACT